MHGLLKLVTLAACLLHVCADASCGYLRLCSRAQLAHSVVGVRAEVPGVPTLPPQAAPRRPASAHARLLSLRGGSDDDEGDTAAILNTTTGGGAAAGQRRARNWADGGGDSVSIEDDSENWDYAKFGLTAPVCEEGVKLNEVCLFPAGTSWCRRARECVVVVLPPPHSFRHALTQGMTGPEGEPDYLSTDHHIGKWGWTALHRAACEVVLCTRARSGGLVLISTSARTSTQRTLLRTHTSFPPYHPRMRARTHAHNCAHAHTHANTRMRNNGRETPRHAHAQHRETP